jgi:hypothetical protein
MGGSSRGAKLWVAAALKTSNKIPTGRCQLSRKNGQSDAGLPARPGAFLDCQQT